MLSRPFTLTFAAVALCLTACTAESTPATDTEQRPPEPFTVDEVASCDDFQKTFRADPKVGEDTSQARIAARGRIIVGVGSDALGLSARQNASGGIDGVEVDLARHIAEDLVGSPDKVELKVVNSADAVAALETGRVDMVINHTPMTCTGWERVAFSAPYMQTPQAVLQRAGNTGRRTCGDDVWSLSLDTVATERIPGRTPGACLVELQRGGVSRIVGGHAVLAGLAEQDPQLELSPGTGAPSVYAVSVRADRSDLAAYISARIADWHATGGWRSSIDRWMGPLGADVSFVKPTYGRTP